MNTGSTTGNFGPGGWATHTALGRDRRTARPTFPSAAGPGRGRAVVGCRPDSPDGLAVQLSGPRLGIRAVCGRGAGQCSHQIPSRTATAKCVRQLHALTHPTWPGREDHRASGHTTARTPQTPTVRGRPRSGHRTEHLRPEGWTPATIPDTWLDTPLGHLRPQGVHPDPRGRQDDGRTATGNGYRKLSPGWRPLVGCSQRQ
jgi:hypothetical protein